MITIYTRTLLTYLLLVLAIRFMGKRQIGELQVSEFIITLMLSEIAVAPIVDREMPILFSVIPMLLLISTEVIVSFVLLKNDTLKRIFYGSPSILISKGKLNQKELTRNRIEIDELLSELRQKGYSDISKINYAILEENGKISVFPLTLHSPVTPYDEKLPISENGLAHACVLDGIVVKHNLTLCGWDESRLFKALKDKKVKLDEVFLLTVDDSGNVNIIRKEKN